MDETTRRKLEMGKRVLDFCRAHPDSNPDFMGMVSRLEASLARLMQQERLGQVRSTLKRKRKLRRTIDPSDSNGMVIPLRKESKGEPTDPAA